VGPRPSNLLGEVYSPEVGFGVLGRKNNLSLPPEGRLRQINETFVETAHLSQ